MTIAGAMALVMLVAVTAWQVARTTPLLGVRTIRYSGLIRIAEAELAAYLPLKLGDNLLGADLEGMERALARHPWVKSVIVQRHLPFVLEVKIEEREPKALVDLGGLYLVDQNAQVFKRAAAGDGLDLPIITGFVRDDYSQRRSEVDATLSGALALIESYEREGLKPLATISEIHVDADQGVTLFLGNEGTQVRLGVGDLPAKLSRLHRVLGTLRTQGARAEVLHLDNRQHPSWVTVRLAGRSGGSTVKVASKVAGRTGSRGP